MSDTLRPQDRISHYRIVSLLGAGGMGEVYRAHDQSLKRDVALKILPPDIVQSEERVRRFVLEARTASSLNHPHIVTIYEIGQDHVRSGDGGPEPGPSSLYYISMELVSGKTLDNKIHQERTGLKTLLGWLAQAAEGLSKAHAAGIVHRDLKPANIMISADGYAKVLDFGLAKLTEFRVAGPDSATVSAMTAIQDGTSPGVMLGTVGYMSPEQVQAKPVDHHSDIFSFGAILYEAATRRRPFEAESSMETMHQILHKTPVPVEKLNPEAPAELRHLIRRCLAKDPNHRLDSMKTLALMLREIVDEYDVLSASATPEGGAPAPPSKGRSRMVPTIAIVVVVAIAATATALWIMRQGDEARKSGAGFQSVQMNTLPGLGDVSSAALSPDGRYVAYVSGPPSRVSLHMRQVSTGSDVEVLAGGAPRTELRFSPDGDRLLYLSPDPDVQTQDALYEIPALGGAPIKRASHVSSGICFAPDGHLICFRRDWGVPDHQQLIILDPKTGQEKTLNEVGAPRVIFTSPSWSPDGQHIAVGETNGAGGIESRVVVYRVSDGHQETVGSDSWHWIFDLVWLTNGSGLVVSAGDLAELRGQLWSLPFPGGKARRITNDVGDYRRVSISSGGTTLVATRQMQVQNLWVADARSGGDARPVTFTTAPENTVWSYTLGRDGSIVFRSMGAPHLLWRIPVDGSAPVQLTTEGFIGYRMYSLPDGDVVCQRVGEDKVPHLWRVDRDGSNPRQLTTGTGEVALAVSPGGETLLFWRVDAVRDVWAVPTTGGQPMRIADDRIAPAGVSGTPIPYSRDGSRIAYRALQRIEGKPMRVWRVTASTGGEPAVTLQLPRTAQDIEWSPDGKSLTYVDVMNGAGNVVRSRSEGGNPEPVTRFTEGELLDHEWSPDGRRLLLVRAIGQVESICITADDGSHAVQLATFKTGHIFDAHWLPPDGRRVVFSYAQVSQDIVEIRSFW